MVVLISELLVTTILYMYDSSTYNCNHNYNNAGILAGMRPCGIIVLLSELFISESKSQVYGCLHNYYLKHPAAAKKISRKSSMISNVYHLCYSLINNRVYLL